MDNLYCPKCKKTLKLEQVMVGRKPASRGDQTHLTPLYCPKCKTRLEHRHKEGSGKASLLEIRAGWRYFEPKIVCSKCRKNGR